MPPAHFATVRGTGENSSTTAAASPLQNPQGRREQYLALLPLCADDHSTPPTRTTCAHDDEVAGRHPFTQPIPAPTLQPACWSTTRSPIESKMEFLKADDGAGMVWNEGGEGRERWQQPPYAKRQRA
ncbi:hypothetical protein GALMADRAFT_209775 [Galerina marginata CBS 339.88]|uniref:Uncharacterized protein n=1 Tax=Galerina marginata (strain CBS 339.88) TaxID=685588 RepID=A0A067T2N8_GALM3|nr:hypothetical protein GALMADRAFT_209775 [Galerina marginata CBS 339.88]